MQHTLTSDQHGREQQQQQEFKDYFGRFIHQPLHASSSPLQETLQHTTTPPPATLSLSFIQHIHHRHCQLMVGRDKRAFYDCIMTILDQLGQELGSVSLPPAKEHAIHAWKQRAIQTLLQCRSIFQEFLDVTTQHDITTNSSSYDGRTPTLPLAPFLRVPNSQQQRKMANEKVPPKKKELHYTNEHTTAVMASPPPPNMARCVASKVFACLSAIGSPHCWQKFQSTTQCNKCIHLVGLLVCHLLFMQTT